MARSSEFIPLQNGVNLHVRDEDTNSPVVILVHGHNEDLNTNNMAKKLVEKFRVIRYDLRRHD